MFPKVHAETVDDIQNYPGKYYRDSGPTKSYNVIIIFFESLSFKIVCNTVIGNQDVSITNKEHMYNWYMAETGKKKKKL